jgi:hypothetical protein
MDRNPQFSHKLLNRLETNGPGAPWSRWDP